LTLPQQKNIGTFIRATEAEKEDQIATVNALQQASGDKSSAALAAIQIAALSGGNVFEAIMDAAKVCSLGQMTEAMFAVGGQYRRNM